MTEVLQDIQYELGDAPPELVDRIKTDPKIERAVRDLDAAGIRLTKSEHGWSDPRSGEQSELAYSLVLLGPGVRNSVWGRSFVFLEGVWSLRQTCQC